MDVEKLYKLSEKLYSELKIEKPLVASFMIIFSRFEYALKRTPEYAMGNERDVTANWDLFASKHEAHFEGLEKTPELSLAIKYLNDNPPKKQVLKNHVLDFDTVISRDKPLQKLLIYVRRVRNNLFHGGKFPKGPQKDDARNALLLMHSCTVLVECLKLNDNVRSHFDG